MLSKAGLQRRFRWPKTGNWLDCVGMIYSFNIYSSTRVANILGVELASAARVAK